MWNPYSPCLVQSRAVDNVFNSKPFNPSSCWEYPSTLTPCLDLSHVEPQMKPAKDEAIKGTHRIIFSWESTAEVHLQRNFF